MELIDINTYRQILGSLIKDPSLFLLYGDIKVEDFGSSAARIIFQSIKNLYEAGLNELSIEIVDQDIIRNDTAYARYHKEGGLEFLNDCILYAKEENFKIYYERLKKLSLLKTLDKQGYDISHYFQSTFETAKEETECIKRFDEATVSSILDYMEGKLNTVRAKYQSGIVGNALAANGLRELKENFKVSPEIGWDLEGAIFSSACRGARLGKFYLRSAKSGLGKSRLAFFDAAKIAIPERFSLRENCFIMDVNPVEGEFIPIEPQKTLIITTEMSKDEVQSILLAYISKVNERHILIGQYDMGEEKRVDRAIEILEKYNDYLYIEEIADPNLDNVSAVIKRYATVEKVKYVFNYRTV